MTERNVTLSELESARHRLASDIRERLTGTTAHFLRTLIRADPDFDAIGLPDAAALPAVRWKLQDLKTLIERDPKKHEAQVAARESLLR